MRSRVNKPEKEPTTEEMIQFVLKCKKRIGMYVKEEELRNLSPIDLTSQYEHYREIFSKVFGY